MKASKHLFCVFLSVCFMICATTGNFFNAIATEIPVVVAQTPVVIDLSTVEGSIVISDSSIEYNNGTDVTIDRTADQILELTGVYNSTTADAVIQLTGSTLPEIKLNSVSVYENLISTTASVTLDLVGENTVFGCINALDLTVNGPGALTVVSDNSAAITAANSVTLQKSASLVAQTTVSATEQNATEYAVEISNGAGVLHQGSTASIKAIGSKWDAQSAKSVLAEGNDMIHGSVVSFAESGEGGDAQPSEDPSGDNSENVTDENTYQVELNWGKLEFTYSFGNWNTATLAYENVGWDSSCNEVAADGFLASNEIQIINQSEAPIYVYESYSDLNTLPTPSGLENGVRFCTKNHQNTTDSTQNCKVSLLYQGTGQFEIGGVIDGTAQSKSTYVLFSKIPDKENTAEYNTEYTQVGEITVKITNAPFSEEESATVPAYTPGKTSVNNYKSSLATVGLSAGNVYDAATGEPVTETADISSATVSYTDVASSSVLPKNSVVNIFANIPTESK